MASGTWSLYGRRMTDFQEDITKPEANKRHNGELSMSEDKKKDDEYINTPDDSDDFDFVMAYDDDPAESDERLLPDNTAKSALSCGFVGVGGGGGKLAKAFLDIGFTKTILVNTTEKDQPGGLDKNHLVLVVLKLLHTDGTSGFLTVTSLELVKLNHSCFP